MEKSPGEAPVAFCTLPGGVGASGQCDRSLARPPRPLSPGEHVWVPVPSPAGSLGAHWLLGGREPRLARKPQEAETCPRPALRARVWGRRAPGEPRGHWLHPLGLCVLGFLADWRPQRRGSQILHRGASPRSPDPHGQSRPCARGGGPGRGGDRPPACRRCCPRGRAARVAPQVRAEAKAGLQRLEGHRLPEKRPLGRPALEAERVAVAAGGA